MARNDSFENAIKWIVIVILAIVALKVVATVLATAFFVGGFLLTKILPLVILVWAVYKGVEWLRGRNGGTPPATTSSTTDPGF